MSSTQTSAAPAPAHAPAPAARFEHFCFEAEDGSSIILNYAGIVPLLRATTCETVLNQLVVFVRAHMAQTRRPTFTLHLFCHGMLMRGLHQVKHFMVLFAKMFKEHFPTELHACYVHQAPSFFASVYDILRPILPKASRDKIVVLRKNDGVPGVSMRPALGVAASDVAASGTADSTVATAPPALTLDTHP